MNIRTSRTKCLTFSSMNLAVLIFLVCQISAGIACSSSKSPGTLISLIQAIIMIASLFLCFCMSLDHIYIWSKQIPDTSNSTQPEVASPTSTEGTKASIGGRAEESQQLKRMNVMIAKRAHAIWLICISLDI